MKRHNHTCWATLMLLIMATPALAWDFIPGPICALHHETDQIAVKLTYDPAAPLYTISLRQKTALPQAPVFSLRFDGNTPISISTDRHVLSDGGKQLTVTDSGFGNVLNGLQFNTRMTAKLGEVRITVPLTGAAEPVAAFRVCAPTAGA